MLSASGLWLSHEAHSQSPIVMIQPENFREGSELLYNASTQLIHASTPLDQLEAVSEYPRSQGASKGALFYFEYEEEVRIDVVAAEWVMESAIPYQVGTRFRLPKMDNRLIPPEGSPLLIPDTRTDERLSSTIREIDLKHQVYACVILLLYNRGQRVAAILFGWNEPRHFDERDERIYTVLQQLAAPVIDSARLFEQTQSRAAELEQVNQEINLLYRTSEIINSAKTYAEVVEAIAQFDLDADVVTLMLWENMDWVTARFLEVAVVIDRTGRSQIKPGSLLPKESFPIAEVMMGERVWIFEDAHTDPRVDPITAENWQMLDIRSFMGPALYIDQRWAGGITFHSARPRKYTERERHLLAGVGDLVIAAILRIRSQQETEAAKEEVDTLYRVGEAINAANSFSELVNAVAGIIDGATAVALYSWEGWDFETAGYVEAIAATDYMQALVGQRTLKAELSYTQDTQGDRLMVLEDVTADSRIEKATVSHYVERRLLAALSIRLYVNQRWIGALVFHSRTPRSFSERERRLALGVGDYVLGAVERIRAREETEAARKRAEAFAAQAHQLAVLEERNRLARELHDSVSQALYGIVLGAQTARVFLDHDPQQAVEPLDYVLALSEAGLAEMRALIFELRPETLENEGLVEALSKQVQMLQARHRLEVKTVFCPEPIIAIQLKEAVYWIAREALHNIIKHANASTVEISLSVLQDWLVLSIVDDGTGFDMSGDFSGHLGLKSMAERALKIGGMLQVHSETGAGTRIHLQLPLDIPTPL